MWFVTLWKAVEALQIYCRFLQDQFIHSSVTVRFTVHHTTAKAITFRSLLTWGLLSASWKLTPFSLGSSLTLSFHLLWVYPFLWFHLPLERFFPCILPFVESISDNSGSLTPVSLSNISSSYRSDTHLIPNIY